MSDKLRNQNFEVKHLGRFVSPSKQNLLPIYFAIFALNFNIMEIFKLNFLFYLNVSEEAYKSFQSCTILQIPIYRSQFIKL